MANPSVVAPHADDAARTASVVKNDLTVVAPAGPRKLVRPPVSKLNVQRHASRNNETQLTAHQALADHAIASAGHESSHAEAFYYQKQVQTQTLMCFVLEDGEKLEGYIEWYDRNAVKIRNNSRTLIYKASIKYLYKAGENLH